nr:uncharacterized protein LOC109191125 [Ipomoea trifida]
MMRSVWGERNKAVIREREKARFAQVMKGLWAKKNGKMKQQAEPIEKQQKMRPKPTSDSKTGLIARSENKEHCNQIKHRSVGNSSAAGAVKCKAWQPSLNSISEAAS